MRRWLARAPFWFYALTSGGFFGGTMALFIRFGVDGHWAQAVLTGALAGAAFGLLMGSWVVRQQRAQREAAGESAYDELVALPVFGRAEALAARPDLREASARVLLRQRERLVRQRRWVVPGLAVILGIELWGALTGSPWLWAFVVLIGAGLAGQFLMPSYLDRQVARLRAPADGDGQAG